MVEDLSMSKNENKSNFLATKDPQLSIVLEELTDKKFDELMERAIFSYKNGESIPFEQFKKDLRTAIGV